MSTSQKGLKFLLALILLAAGSASEHAHACTVPVFRYALERWPAEPYRVYIFHRGALATPDDAAIDVLRKSGDTTGYSNLVIETVNLAGNPTKEQLALWNEHKSETLPWAVVLYPESSDPLPPMWAGKLDTQSAAMLIDSPVRKEVGQRLLKGESVVWVLLESGQKEADAAAAELLNKEISVLEKLIVLPEQGDPEDADPASRLHSGLPLRVAFSTLRVSRDDPREQLFVKMLVQSQPAMKDLAPMVFPIFGRGRLLTGIRGKEFNAASFKIAAEFLTGACSCQVKELNPGVDLLMSVEWEKVFDEKHAAAVKLSLPEVTSQPSTKPAIKTETAKILTTPLKATPIVDPLTAEKPERIVATAEAQSQPLWLWIATVIAGFLVLVTGRAVLKQSRRN